MNKLKSCRYYNGWKWTMGFKKKRSRNYGHLKGLKTVETIIKSILLLK